MRRWENAGEFLVISARAGVGQRGGDFVGHQSPPWAPWVVGRGFRQGSPTCLTAQVAASMGFVLQLPSWQRPTAESLLYLRSRGPVDAQGGRGGTLGESLQAQVEGSESRWMWKLPEAGHGNQAVLPDTRRVLMLARLPEPWSSTNITFPPLCPLHFHPGVVLDSPGNASWGEEIEGIFSYNLNWLAEFIEFAGFSSFEK